MSDRTAAPTPAAVAPQGPWDRCRHRRGDERWIDDAWRRARVLVIDVSGGGDVLFRDSDRPDTDGASATLPLMDSAEAPPGERLFLGTIGGTPVFAVVAPLPAVPGTGTGNLRGIGHRLSETEAALLTAATALRNWHAAAGYSPATGAVTRPVMGGWARADDSGTLVRPRVDPAVLVLVHDGGSGPDGRCLLAHRAPGTMVAGTRQFSSVAGFVEPGESPEQAAAREVAEEIGVTLTGLRYAGSQAWPYPGCLMLGFRALADPREPIRTDPTEIAAAGWFTRRQIAEALAGAPVETVAGGLLALPPRASLAWSLLADWAGGPAGWSAGRSAPTWRRPAADEGQG
ncbi:NAD(+) diphosphatase [Micromonospora sp. CA-111912]|uniref:NAD(+) diphosphatase n=1 Tax=Micromonospora sp. CA-111912 TaxID=3239955 RepID=UPI003D8ADF1E